MATAEFHCAYVKLKKITTYLNYFLKFRKINKMKCDSDTKWTEKLQTKKSTCYTQFYLMFGRNFDSSNLLNLLPSPNSVGMDSQMLTELVS